MQLQISKQINSAKNWNEDVIKCSGCTFHSYEWSLASARQNNSTPLYLRWFDGNGDIKLIGFSLTSGKSIFYAASNKTFSMSSLPAGLTKSQAPEILKDLINFCKSKSYSVLQINSFGTPLELNILQKFGFKISRRWEFIVSLDSNKNDLWKKLHSKKRNMIRKGQKSDLTIKNTASIKGIHQLRKLAIETQNRKANKGITFTAGDIQYYTNLKNDVIDRGIGKLYLAYSNQVPVAAAFFVGFNKKVYYVLSSASQEGLKMAAPDLLIWTSMIDYMKDGFLVFNLGGLSETELQDQELTKSGLYHFKKRFSAEVQPCYKGEIILRPSAYKNYTFLKKIKDNIFS